MAIPLKNFDLFIGIDWSGAKAPVQTRAIAVSTTSPVNAAPVLIDKRWSRQMVFDYILAIAATGQRTLVGIDCNFGYSEKIGAKQFGPDYTHLDLWNAVESANHDEPNFFAGGYWAHEDHGRHFWQSGTLPSGFEMPRRQTESVCGESGLGWPESPFKLIGAKQVGKGGFAGMRMALALKERLGRALAVWPFDPDTDRAKIVLTEIYPRLFLKLAGHGNTKIRCVSDLNMVLKALQSGPLSPDTAFSDHQADALASAAALRLLCGTAKTIPEEISNPPASPRILGREGWIFGAGASRLC